MNGLLLKDLYCIKGYMKQMWFVLICLAVLGIYIQNPAMVGFYLIFISMSILSTTISADEKTQWDRLALTFPLKKQDVIKGKYLLFLIMSAGAILLSLIFNFLIYVLYMAITPEEIFLSSFLVFFIYMFAFCIYIPAIYKMGADKARFVLFGILMIPLILVLSAAKMFPQLENLSVGAEMPAVCGILLVILVLAFILSYRMSLKFYNEKEF